MILIDFKKYVVISVTEVIKMGRHQRIFSGATVLILHSMLMIGSILIMSVSSLNGQTTLLSDDPQVEERLRNFQASDRSAIIIQQGNNNEANLDVNASGQGQIEVLLQQDGSFNSSDVDIESVSGELNILQKGNYHTADLENIRFNNSELTLIQVGEAHNLVQKNADIQSSNTEIYQEGTNHNLEIESNLEIEGMRISQYGNGANIRISNQ